MEMAVTATDLASTSGLKCRLWVLSIITYPDIKLGG
jgi:hypothetical protein